VLPPTPTPESTKTPLPDFSGRPTLSPADLAPEVLRAMVVWREVESAPRYVLYQLTDTSQGAIDADWSPDGRRVALWIATAGQTMGWWPTALAIADRNGRAIWGACEPEDERCDASHSWSPEGDRIVYTRDGRLWIADADGTSRRALPLPKGYETLHLPGFSPDGRRIAALAMRIEEDGAHYDMFGFGPDSGDHILLIPDAGDGAYRWSPSGRRLAHMGEGHGTAEYPIGVARLSIADLDSMTVVSRDIGSLSGTEVANPAPAWLAGEEKVLVTLAFSLGVWTIDVDGNVTRLDEGPETSGRGRLPGLAAPLEGSYCDGAAVSPDGRYVVYSAGGMHLRVLDVLSGQRVELGDGDLCHGVVSVAWAPRGSQFLKLRGSWPIELVDAADGSATEFAPSGTKASWSPDGRWVAYWVGEGDGYALHVTEVTTRESFRVGPACIGHPYGNPFPARWAPDSRALTFGPALGGRVEMFLVELRS
jgi:Tol biopolymer transport system component